MLTFRALRVLSAVSVIAMAIAAYGFSAEGPIDKIVAALNGWTDKSPQEKVYLHTDKPYYAIGDTIYFKAYLTTGSRHKLSGISGTLYVDLVNEKNQAEKNIKIPITVGMGRGSFVLDDGMSDGNYRLRAYTGWMRNAGPDYFFDKTFTILKVKSDIYTRIAYQYSHAIDKPELQAVISYTDQNGAPIADRDIKAEIKKADKTTIKRLKTDDQGNITVPMSMDKDTGFKNTYLQTTLERKDKTEFIKVFAVKANMAQTDVQFFPEGGNLVNGLVSRVGFKAVGLAGTGVSIKGRITDNNNTEIATFESAHAGMGRFNFMPEAGKTYTAKITFPDSYISLFSLPAATNDGYVLSVYNNLPNDSILVKIATPANAIKTAQTFSLVAQTGGEVFYASQIKISKSITTLRISQKPFPTGIAQFTLFNEGNEPLSERIAFIRNNDQMQLTLSTAWPAYKSREKVQIALDAKDRDGKPVIGSFSVSVTSEAHIPVNENMESTILSNILLTSDLKGYVETPNYYFVSQSKEVDKELDDLMLTQGYRRFLWKNLLGAKPDSVVFKAEKITSEISGKLLTLSNKPLPGGKVLLFSPQANIIKDTLSDADGRFKFNVLHREGVKFNIQGRSDKNSSKVQVVIDKIPAQEASTNKNIGDIDLDIYDTNKAFIAGKRQEGEILQKFGKLNEVQQLAQVNIKAKKPEKTQVLGGFSIPEVSADQVYIPDSVQICGTLWMCLSAQLRGVEFQTKGSIPNWPHTYIQGKLAPMVIIVDGSRIDSLEASDIFNGGSIDISDIQKIQIVRTSLAQMTMLGGPAILIYSKRGFTRKTYDPSIIYVTPRGFSKVKEFYAPRYDVKNDATVPDLRSTIYWNDNIRTGEDGKANFDFYNSDNKGRYRVVVEGINAAGELGRQVYFYAVE